MFTPHVFEPKYNGLPIIRFNENVLLDMWHITQISSIEASWWCTTVDQPDNCILVDELVLPKQKCGAVDSEITAEGEAEVITDFNLRDTESGTSLVGPDARVNRLRGWFHSHVTMGTSPSAPDLAQVEKWRMKAQLPYIVRGIVNKAGRLQVAFYDFRSALKNVYVEDVPWECVSAPEVEDSRKARWRAELAAKVSDYHAAHYPKTRGYFGEANAIRDKMLFDLPRTYSDYLGSGAGYVRHD